MKKLYLIVAIAIATVIAGSAAAAPLNTSPAASENRLRNLEVAEAGRIAEAQRESIQRDVDDLSAQEAMATSAERMAEYTFWQIIVGMVGAAVVTISLLQSRKAIASSAKALDQNAELISLTQSHAELQLKAYPACANVTIDGLKSSAKAIIEYKNYGQTPALYIRPRMTVELSRENPVNISWRDIPEEHSISTKHTLVPNAVTKFFSAIEPPLTSDDILDIESKSAWLVVRAEVEFEDLFGNVTRRRHSWLFFDQEAKERIVLESGCDETLLSYKANDTKAG